MLRKRMQKNEGDEYRRSAMATSEGGSRKKSLAVIQVVDSAIMWPPLLLRKIKIPSYITNEKTYIFITELFCLHNSGYKHFISKCKSLGQLSDLGHFYLCLYRYRQLMVITWPDLLLRQIKLSGSTTDAKR